MKNINVENLGKPLDSGCDSNVYKLPGNSRHLLKVYPTLSLAEIQRYHAIHRKYAEQGEEFAPVDKLFQKYGQQNGFEYLFLGKRIEGAVVDVLHLSSDTIEENTGSVLVKVPYIQGMNLLNHWDAGVSKSDPKDKAATELTFFLIEHMVHTGLKKLGITFEKREKGTGGILQVGHNIVRENIMIRGIDEKGYVQATVTDLGASILEAIWVEDYLYGQSK